MNRDLPVIDKSLFISERIINLMTKGISLSIETIIVIILAVTVMSTLMMFFNNNWTDFTLKTDYEKYRRELCYSLVAANKYNCDNIGSTVSSWSSGYKNFQYPEAGKTPAEVLGTACQKLGTNPACGGSLNDACIKQCCATFCGIQSKI